MTSILEAILLGIVQGLTEFLPVSSSGHLELVKYLIGDKSRGDISLLMTVILHLATALATIYVFRRDIGGLLRKTMTTNVNDAHYYLGKIILSMIPAAIVGLFFEDLVEALYSQRLLMVGFALWATAGLLIVADRAKGTRNHVKPGSAFLIGVAQAVAIIPGISRSGATIATAVLLKIDRDRAARFSFLMVVPVILGKMIKDLSGGGLLQVENIEALVAGFLASFVTGILACQWMLKLVRQAKLRYFGWYCFLVGFLSIILSMQLFSYA